MTNGLTYKPIPKARLPTLKTKMAHTINTIQANKLSCQLIDVGHPSEGRRSAPIKAISSYFSWLYAVGCAGYAVGCAAYAVVVQLMLLVVQLMLLVVQLMCISVRIKLTQSS